MAVFSDRLKPLFKYPQFRALLTANSLSQIGTWSHDLARAWLVLEIAQRAGALGSMLLASALPSLVLIVYGGTIVDLVRPQRLMMLTKTLLAISAFSLAFLVYFLDIQLWQILVFAFIEGCITAFDAPAFTKLTSQIVPGPDFQKALSINSIVFHASRALGPLIAGLLLAWKGAAFVFLFDGFSYILLFFVLRSLRPHQKQDRKQEQEPTPTPTETTQTALKSKKSLLRIIKKLNSQTKEGFQYLFTTPLLRYLVLQLFLTVAFLFPVSLVLFRTYLKQKFNLTGEGFGVLFSFPAAGALLGALLFTMLHPKRPMSFLKVTIPLVPLLLLSILYMPNKDWTALALFLNGIFSYLNFVALTISLHLYTLDKYRGRMSSLIGMCFVSIGPLMSFPIGALADAFGFHVVTHYILFLYLITSLILALLHKTKIKQ